MAFVRAFLAFSESTLDAFPARYPCCDDYDGDLRHQFNIGM